nr:HAMP domain-containing sensor histidine kinase [Aestuariibacter sp. A3R04]
MQLPRFEQNNRRLSLDIPQEAEYLECRGSAHLFTEVFNNLIENAYSHGMGAVMVSITVAEKLVQVHIRDEGESLKDISLSLLSTRFYKANSDTQGSGLGLSIVHSILPHISANLTLSPSPTTCFTLSLPYLSQKAIRSPTK